MRSSGPIVALALCWSLALLGCSTVQPGTVVDVEGGSYTTISPAQFSEMLNRKDFFLVNVHIPYAGEIAPTDAFIPYDQTLQRLGEYPADKTARIVVYCMTNFMSGMAAEQLVKAGYTRVYLLLGGMSGWKEAGFPLKVDEGKE